jgi:hypothetical protein
MGSPSGSLVACSTAIGKPNALVLILSASQRQASEMFRVVLSYLRQIPGVTIAAESVLRVELGNGARVIALPSSEATIRGYAGVDLLICDEAARIPNDLIQAARPFLATSSGRMIALSTPKGRRGWFFDSWHDDESSWERVRVTTDMCPRISKAFLDDELRALGAQRFAEEYGLEFLEGDDAVFPTAVIDAAFTDDVARLWA